MGGVQRYLRRGPLRMWSLTGYERGQRGREPVYTPDILSPGVAGTMSPNFQTNEGSLREAC